MTKLYIRATAFLIMFVIAAPLQASSPQVPTAPKRGDPAVEAYTTFVKGMKLTQGGPVDLEFVVAALDRIVSAAEGLALARDVATDTLLTRGHEIRRDMRRLARNDSTAIDILKKKTDVFVAISELLGALHVALGPKQGAEQWAIDALKRSAEGLDFEYPLKWQPGAIQGFLEIGAKVLQQMSAR